MKFTMRAMLVMFLTMICGTAFAVQVFNSSGQEVGQFSKFKCGAGMSCTRSGSQMQMSSAGGLDNKVTFAASGSLTASQCGSLVMNSGAVTVTMPEASTVIGCSYKFVTGNASTFNLNPADGTDTIQVLTNAAGDSIANATLGNSVVLEAVSADAWAPIGAEKGTWTDSN